VSINPSGIAFHRAYTTPILIRPSFDAIGRSYQRFRIPRPPEFDPEGTAPGKICWGTVGQMPSPIPIGGTDFTVKEHWQETSRVSDIVRVENPDDPNQYVMEDRPKQVTFQRTTNSPPAGPNTSSQSAPGMSDYSDADQAGFVETGHGPPTDSGAVVMQYMNPAPGFGPS
jgi:hypothetical protein